VHFLEESILHKGPLKERLLVSEDFNVLTYEIHDSHGLDNQLLGRLTGSIPISEEQNSINQVQVEECCAEFSSVHSLEELEVKEHPRENIQILRLKHVANLSVCLHISTTIVIIH
jgi:hypothetical protein